MSLSINQIKQRFMAVNQARLERVHLSQQELQRQFLELLPLLFHCNSNLLPGYVGDTSPFGVLGYKVDNQTIRSAQKFNRNFIYKPKLSPPQIISLYLMGSSGTVAQSTTSDFDIWLCYQPGISTEKVFMLEQKASAISQWAETLNLEVHFFMMDAHRFKAGHRESISGENAGSTQFNLLLDEFYRTSVLVAGAPPMWWYVDPLKENDYEKQVHIAQDVGQLNYLETIDFGGLGNIEAGEFIGAAMWQIYKGIDSPYKSVLKLALLESYTQHFPRFQTLAQKFKQAIFNNEIDIDDLDPYVLMYQQIENYLLSRNETQRLEVVRRCFYFKVNIPLSRAGKRKASSWRRQGLSQIMTGWNWSNSWLEHLDNRNHWTVEEVIEERKALVNELTYGYRYINQFATHHDSSHHMTQQDLVILGRKLFAAFDKKAGKIDFINPHISNDLSQERIAIYHIQTKRSDQWLWAVYTKPIDRKAKSFPAPLKHCRGFLEALLWCHCNGLIDAHLHIPVFSDLGPINEFELKKIIASLRHIFVMPLSKARQEAFQSPAVMEQVMIFANVGTDPMQTMTKRGLQKVSARNDSLDYSGVRENLVVSLDMVVINSWNEVIVTHFEQEDCLSYCLQQYLNQLVTQGVQQKPVIDVVCHCVSRPDAIRERVSELFNEVTNLYINQRNQHFQYLLAVKEGFQLLVPSQQGMECERFKSITGLYRYLAKPKRKFIPIQVDRTSIIRHPILKLMLHDIKPGEISIYFLAKNKSAKVWIWDEFGSLNHFKTDFFQPSFLIKPLTRFLRLMEYRQNSETTNAEMVYAKNIKFYSLKTTANKIEVTPFKAEADISNVNFVNAQVLVNEDSFKDPQYLMQINGKEFDSLTLGDDLFNEVASYIKDSRPSHEGYPCYITDLQISDRVKMKMGVVQTVHYLELKRKVEDKLNKALKG